MLLLASIALIVVATTMPWSYYYVGHSHWPSVEWVPFSRQVRPVDFVLNVMMFLPFGYSASVLVTGRDGSRAPSEGEGPSRPSRRGPYLIGLVVVAACVLSLAVEVFQVFCHGRTPTMTDVLSNGLGAYLGTRIGRGRTPSRLRSGQASGASSLTA